MTIKELRKHIQDDEENFAITEGRKEIGFVTPEDYKEGSCAYSDYDGKMLPDDALFAKGGRVFLVMGDAA